MFAARVQAWFDALSVLTRDVRAEVFALFRAECSDFARFNHARLRQAGTVERQAVELRVIDGRRVAGGQFDLSGDADEDRERLRAALQLLVDDLPHAAEDPFLLLSETAGESSDCAGARMPQADELQALVARAADGLDLVGAYMGGPIAQALWSSRGHRHRFERACWSFDFSLYLDAGDDKSLRNKAVKSTAAGIDWNAAAVEDAIRLASRKLAVLRRPAIVLPPGDYDALLAPAAVGELFDILCWGGFSARSQLTGQSPLARWRAGPQRMSPAIHLSDDLGRIASPAFQADGFVREPRIDLIRAGAPGVLYCSPRSAQEFSIESNGADAGEAPLTMSLAPGSLAASQALARLGTGLDISNLWYLNYSDRMNARVTGMTRFASLWVENGQWQAPIEPMRFDDGLIDLLGERLVDLGDEPQWLPELSSWDWRGCGGKRMPSALVRAMRFTL